MTTIKLKSKGNSNASILPSNHSINPGGVPQSDGARQKHHYFEFRLPERDITIDSFVERVQIHGVIDWYRAKSCSAKTFWAFMIVGLMLLLIFGVMMSVIEFYTNPVNTSIFISTANTVPFPEVYLCPANSIDYTSELRRLEHLDRFLKKQKFDIFGDTKSIWAEMLPKFKPLDNFDFPSEGFGAEFLTTTIPPLPPPTIRNYKLLLQSISIPPKRLFQKCEFEGLEVDCDSIVTPKVDKDHNMCYLVNVGRPQRSERIGLRLLIDLSTHLDDSRIPAPFYGLYFTIAKNVDPFGMVMDVSSPGKYVKVNMDVEYHELINVPYSRTPQHCANEGYAVGYKVLQGNYSGKFCSGDCVQSAVVEQCDCILTIDPEYVQEKNHDKEFCDVSKTINCAQKVIRDREKSIKECSKQCLRSCQSWTVHPRLSSMDLTSARSRANIQPLPTVNQTLDDVNIITPSYWHENFVLLDIAFSNLHFTSVVQSEAKTIAELLSDIGGQTGLWLGTSMFSFLQVGVLFMGYFYTNAHRNRDENL